MLCGWNEAALWDVFREGLNPEIQDEIAIHDLPASFDDLVDLALRVETRINLRRQRVMTHPSWPIPRSVAEAATVHPEPLSEVEPMQVGRTRLAAEEKQRRLNQRLCFYCGKSGHFAAACPLKARARQ